MQQRINGEVVSFAPMQAFVRGASYAPNPNPVGDGWNLHFSYRCGCGAVHSASALHVWPTGNHKIDTLEHTCPNTNEQNQIELVRPQ